MTPRALLRQTALRFRDAGIPDPETDSALLLSDLTGRAPLNLRVDTDTQLDDTVLTAFEELCRIRMTRMPLQYMRHSAMFYGREFFVDEHVLIPRPETEGLLDLLEGRIHREGCIPRLLDLCTGSGCIGITAKLENPFLDVTCTDLSSEALNTARKNADRLHAQVTLKQGNLLDAVSGEKFGLLLSNPPYIPSEECNTLQEEVRLEPRLALDGGEDGLFFYRQIANCAPEHLMPNSFIALEIGVGQADTVCQYLEQSDFQDLAIYTDISGLERYVTGTWAGGE